MPAGHWKIAEVIAERLADVGLAEVPGAGHLCR
jgi:hypothetical protein